MVASNRELANIFCSFKNSLLSNLLAHNNMNTNMKINTPKDQSNVFSTNNSRKLSMYLSVLFISYVERIQALNNSSFWANQVENNKFQRFSLFYVSLKIGNIDKANEATVITNMLESQKAYVNLKVLKCTLFPI